MEHGVVFMGHFSLRGASSRLDHAMCMVDSKGRWEECPRVIHWWLAAWAARLPEALWWSVGRRPGVLSHLGLQFSVWKAVTNFSPNLGHQSPVGSGWCFTGISSLAITFRHTQLGHWDKCLLHYWAMGEKTDSVTQFFKTKHSQDTSLYTVQWEVSSYRYPRPPLRKRTSHCLLMQDPDLKGSGVWGPGNRSYGTFP